MEIEMGENGKKRKRNSQIDWHLLRNEGVNSKPLREEMGQFSLHPFVAQHQPYLEDQSRQTANGQAELFFFNSLFKKISFYFIYLFLFFWSCHAACGILVPWPGIKPVPHAVEEQSLNHWTTREVPSRISLSSVSIWHQFHLFIQSVHIYWAIVICRRN